MHKEILSYINVNNVLSDSFDLKVSIILSSSNLGFVFIPRYSLDISIPIDFLPNIRATRFVVPVPQNGSRTTPSIGQVARIGILHKSSGYGAKWSNRFCVSSGMMSHTSLGLLPFGWYIRK